LTPAAAVSAAGLGSEYMPMYVTGHKAGATPGTMQSPVRIKAGEEFYSGSRSGDFSGITRVAPALCPVTYMDMYSLSHAELQRIQSEPTKCMPCANPAGSRISAWARARVRVGSFSRLPHIIHEHE
jgi:hypothetical protein